MNILVKPRSPRRTALERRVGGVAGAALLAASVLAYRALPPSQGPYADFVEPGFPFIVTTVDARQLGPAFAPGNVATRGVVVQLGNDSYAAFDPDLLRMAVAWEGKFLELTTMAQISYQEAGNKNNQIPKVLGTPLMTTGVYPGWWGGTPDFKDPRAPGPNPEDPGRGPISTDQGRWNGVYVMGDRAVLAYTVQGADVQEQPGSEKVGQEVGIVRAFRIGARPRALTLAAAEVGGGHDATVRGSTALVPQGGDTLTAVGMVGAPRGARLQVVENRYVTLQIPPGGAAAPFRVVLWRGPAAARGAFDRMLKGRTEMVDPRGGGPAHWPGSATTRGVVAPDTAPYVVDRLTLPIPNPWRRNLRVADADFFSDGRAAVVTFEGDVWIVSGIDRGLERLEWKRFSSGLFEPMSLQVVDDEVYVYGREGLVRPRDLNGDGEADYYESFSNLVHQSIESREFPLSMDEKPGGGFYLSRGGALDNGPRTAPAIAPGFRAGSRHAGSVLEVSADGRALSVFATGLREPFIGVHPQRGLVAASDQQGNFVPSTPVYLLSPGGYYGVVPTAHRADPPAAGRPLAWIPHSADRSGAGEVWVTGDRMGFGGDALLHLSYGRPGLFRIYSDSSAGGATGAALSLLRDFPDPLLKGEYNPRDGFLYLAGFKVWDSNAKTVTAFDRLRYTGQPPLQPLSVQAGTQGVLLRFATPLDRATATAPGRYQIQRYNYKRTQDYGSGYFKLDGSIGQDTLRVAAAHLSADGTALLLVVPDVREVMQMSLAYDLRTTGGRAITDTLYLTLPRVAEMSLAPAGFGEVDWRKELSQAAPARPAGAAAQPTAQLGAQVYQRAGCVACHSADGTTEGRMGPTFRGLFGSIRTFAAGTSRRADEAYIRQSILQPASQIVRGYPEGMPSFLGVLSDREIESLVLYLRSLGG